MCMLLLRNLHVYAHIVTEYKLNFGGILILTGKWLMLSRFPKENKGEIIRATPVQ